MKVSIEILNELADSLESGFKCYIHKDTLEVVTFLDEDRFPDMDPEAWKEERAKVSKQRKKYIEIEAMDSTESFRMMEDFVFSLDNESIKARLIQALEGRKPFANFKHQIENSGEYREMWFSFRRNRNIEWVQDQLDPDRL